VLLALECPAVVVGGGGGGGVTCVF